MTVALREIPGTVDNSHYWTIERDHPDIPTPTIEVRPGPESVFVLHSRFQKIRGVFVEFRSVHVVSTEKPKPNFFF
jgi:hypothetical protein